MRKSLKIAVVIVLFFGLLFSVIGAFSFGMIVSDTLPEDYGKYNILQKTITFYNKGIEIINVPIARNDGFIYFAERDRKSNSIHIKCHDEIMLKEVWSTDIGDADVFSITVHDFYLFCVDLNSGLIILGNRDGEVIKNINLCDELGIDNKNDDFKGIICTPVPVSSKIYCKYVLTDSNENSTIGVACFSQGDFSTFFIEEYLTSANIRNFSPTLFTDGEFAYGIFETTRNDNKLIRINPYGGTTEIIIDEDIEEPFFYGDSLQIKDKHIYIVMRDLMCYLLDYDLESGTAKISSTSYMELEEAETNVTDKNVIITTCGDISVYSRESLKLIRKISNVNFDFSPRTFINNTYIYVPTIDMTLNRNTFISKIEIETGEILFVDTGVEITNPELFLIGKNGVFIIEDSYEKGSIVSNIISKYSYIEDYDLIADISSGILDGEVNDLCAHEMKLQIGNRYWATNGYMIEKPLDMAPVVRHDRTFIEIRSVTEKVGAEISWIANERAVVIKGLKGEDIKLKIGNPVATVNGEEVQIDEAGIIPFIENGRTMLPLRFVSESLGLVVGWDAKKKIITLHYENPACNPCSVKLKGFDGETYNTCEFLGEPVLLNFIAGWCEPCIKSFPALNNIFDKYGDDIRVISVDIDSWEEIVEMTNEHEIPWLLLVDDNRELAKTMGITAIPTFILYDLEGEVVFKDVGLKPDTEKILSDEIEKLLNP